MTIWKFDLKVEAEQSLLMPQGAKILCVQTQSDFPKLWAEVDPSSPVEPRSILTFVTGQEWPSFCGHYIGTYQMGLGKFVAHVYEGRLL